MALLQISEPGQSTVAHQHRLAAGIDLGTTNSLVASVRSGQADTLADDGGERILPSVVHYGENEVVVGRSAVSLAASDPLNTVTSVKRLIGRGLDDIKVLGSQLPYQFVQEDSAVPRIQTRRGAVSPIEVSAEILKTLSARAEASLGGELSGVVITVPAYFDEAQRQATKDAAKLAGLNVFRLLNEPTAAAVAYGLDQDVDGLHAIYDLGGGTFDISVLRLHKGVFEVIATGGDSALGGDDIDHQIAVWIIEQAKLGDDLDRGAERQLLQLARQAKEALSDNSSTEIGLTLDDTHWKGVLDRDTLNQLVDPLIRRTVNACRRALRDAGVTVDDIKDVVMVGGSTRLYRVREKVAAFFEQEPMIDIDPDSVVAIGAALQADLLAGNKPDEEMLLLDVTPLSLGIETMGGLVEKVIPRNTTIPVARAQEFTTFKDGQTAMSIHVVQGERDLVQDCRSLARFELRDFPPMVAGAARIRVTFTVDADGLLSVEAQEDTSGKKASVVVKPSYGLTDNEIAEMLQSSMSHADDDLESRKLVEQRVEADRVLEALRSAMSSDAEELLDTREIEMILESVAGLEASVKSGTAEHIERAIKQLEKTCEFYVERRMNANIHKAMAGHNVSDFE